MIITVKTTVKELFENKERFMRPSNGDVYLYFRQVRKDRRTEGVCTDVLRLNRKGRYKVSKSGGKAVTGNLSPHTKVLVFYESKAPEPRIFEKLETFEQMVARIAPPQPQTLSGRYDTRTIHREVQEEAEF